MEIQEAQNRRDKKLSFLRREENGLQLTGISETLSEKELSNLSIPLEDVIWVEKAYAFYFDRGRPLQSGRYGFGWGLWRCLKNALREAGICILHIFRYESDFRC